MVLYQDVTKRASRISKLTKIPLTTVYDWIKKIESDIDIFVVQPGRGIQSKITQEVKDEIIDAVTEKPTTSSLTRLAAENNISKSSTYNIIKEAGMKFKPIQNNYHNFTPEEKASRVEYCQNMLKRKGASLENVFFADEMGINIKDTHAKHAWVLPGKKVKTQKPEIDLKLNCWAAISRVGATSLHIFQENLNQQVYQDILKEHKSEMEKLYPKGYTFIHDNYKPHLSSESWMKQNQMEIEKFPTYSPDLNPIENLWGVLKNQVQFDAPKTEEELINSLQTNWKKLTQPKKLKPYFDGLQKRYQACIESQGDKINY
ncbi:hypothetical protein ABPG72_005872 [Tetrahymena utriculariae]